jgi:hypothetical protein
MGKGKETQTQGHADVAMWEKGKMKVSSHLM